MNPSEQNIVELAKQGNPKAIASLINRQLSPKGINVKTSLQDTCLQIFLESLDPPLQEHILPFIHRGMSNLGVKVIKTVKVYGSQVGSSSALWTEEFTLDTFVEDSEDSQESVSENIPDDADVEAPESTKIPKDVKSAAPTTAYRGNHRNSAKSSEPGFQIQNTLKDALEGLKIFVSNPVGGLPIFYQSLGKKRALAVGITFGIFYITCLLFSVHRTLSNFSFFLGYSRFNVAQILGLGATQFISFAVASISVRKIFRGFGCPEGDIFIAGSSLLAPGFLMLLSTMLGGINFEIILILSVLSITYLILTLYTGCKHISQIPDSLSQLAVVGIILLSLWFSKIIISSALY
ncbi:MAG: hypothetical protein QNJ63_12615 [Calothrix sp. MO_192.B10]|nr:hypothetical protein [Calothrix sp. MO_192.B10]